MAGLTTLVATLAGTLSHEAPIPDAVKMLRVQGDLTEGISARSLRSRFSGELLYSLPCRNSVGSATARHESLIHAALEYDLVELHADYDLSPRLLQAIPTPQRLISWRGTCSGADSLRSVFERIRTVPARFYSMILQGSSVSDAVTPLLFLNGLGRKDVSAICEGKAGFCSRILAPHFGAPLVFGKLESDPVGDSGEPSIQQLTEDYGFPRLFPIGELYGIVGNRVFQSLSPRLHNAAYRSLHHPAWFLPFYVESFEDFWREVIDTAAFEPLGLAIKGLTIVSPHKESAFALAPKRSSIACSAAACNIFVNKNGSWEAHTTDPESIAGVPMNGRKVKAAVIGCGGAGRAIAAVLQQAGVEVTLVNRGKERGELAVRLLRLPFVPLSEFRATNFSLVINATPVGRDGGSTPFEVDNIGPGATVVDLVYGAQPTPLVAAVVARGGAVIDGYDVLLNQVRTQFRMMTGREMPAAVSRDTLLSPAFGHLVRESLSASRTQRLAPYGLKPCYQP